MLHQRHTSLSALGLTVFTAFLAGCGPEPGVSEWEGDEPAAALASAELARGDDDCSPKRGSKRELSADLVGRYATGIVGLESSGETAALHRQRLYVTSAQAAALDVVDVRDPAAPKLITRVDLTVYGPSVQSVDVSARGLVAVAVGGAAKTDPGTIVFLDRNGGVLRTATVGALPDMVAFTHDGDKLVAVNEGEPGCYGEGCIDPLGSVSIIQVHPLRASLPVTTLDFEGIPLPAGVRVFGPGATPAQDLEPEGIAISADDRTAYITLQENNALAVIDLRRGQVKEVRALGYKDLATPPTTTTVELKRLPSIGKTAAGQELVLGGFSGLFFEGKTESGKLRFVTHTDRGPNAEPTGVLRPFLLPNFNPRIVRLELEPERGSVRITQQIGLKRADGSPLSGVANTAIEGGNGNTPYNDEVPVDLFGNVLPLDPLGGDFEGLVVAPDGTFWLADEYRPAIYHFSANGRLLARLIPAGTHAAAGLPVPAAGVAGELGIEALPAVIAQRRQNRGFEAIAMQNGKLYAFVQSPIRNPASLANAALNAMQNVRLIELDPATLATRQFIYIMDNPPSTGAADTRADKIGDMTAVPGGGFMVVERDDDALPEDPVATITKKVYAFSLNGATDVTPLDTLYDGLSLDQMTPAALQAANIKPIAKTLHVDLAQTGYAGVEKIEGLAMIDATTLALVNDNDFGVAGIVVDQASGTYTLAEGYVPEPVSFGLVKTSGFDASDRDGVANIRNWPVFGMYQPDAVSAFKACGETYLATANEGDARDWEGFAEEVRVRAQRAKYPNIPEATDDLQLGRLTITNSPPDGDLSRPYVFGTRSFSLWNARTGALVWDSGADFETQVAAAFPANFNGTHDANDFDTRSDNKGPEPEGVAVGQVGGRLFAFVGLERIGGVMIYDVSNPVAPEFVRYLNTRDFSAASVGPDSGPEIVKFVPAEASPTRSPLLVISHEITGTVTMWRLGLD